MSVRKIATGEVYHYLSPAIKPAGIILPELRKRIPMIPPRTVLVPRVRQQLEGLVLSWYAPKPRSEPNSSPAPRDGMLPAGMTNFRNNDKKKK